MGFEPAFPTFIRTRTKNALKCLVTGIGSLSFFAFKKIGVWTIETDVKLFKVWHVAFFLSNVGVL
jgi:hypothetical protein